MCVDASSNRDEPTKYEEELKFLEAWLEKTCVDDVCIKDVVTNVEDNMADIKNENVNEIFVYWSSEDIKFYYELLLQQIDNQSINDKEQTIEDEM